MSRILVGVVDIAFACLLYLLCLSLQGRPVSLHVFGISQTILSLATLTAILTVLRTVLDMASTELVFDQVQSLYTTILLRLVSGYNQMSWGQFTQRNRSELVGSTIHAAGEAADFFHRWVELCASIVILLAMAAVMIYQSPLAASGFGVALAIAAVPYRLWIRSRLQGAATEKEAAMRLLQRSVADVLSSGKEVRTYRLQGFFGSRIQRQAQRYASAYKGTVFLPQIGRTLADQAPILLLLAILVRGQLRGGNPEQLLALLAFFFVLSRRLFPLMSQISLITGQMDAAYQNVHTIAEELDECARYRAATTPVGLPRPGFALVLQGVSFWFHERERLLHEVNLSVQVGEFVILQGASGTGKTALLNVVAGVLEPCAGQLQVNRERIAYVPQEAPLFDDSVRNNLLFGSRFKSDRELYRALSLAGLDNFIGRLPLGLETNVGDNGALLSGGQRQRLGIARALLRDVDLLLLDEATSALDEQGEEQILQTLRQVDKTILLVTHRVHARRFADRVFHLHSGRLSFIAESESLSTRA
jgi:ABC-type bacteriocin/lantibiotic exporter with double-glycine peptidase domain